MEIAGSIYAVAVDSSIEHCNMALNAEDSSNSVPPPRNRDWERDTVYLFQLPRTHVIPSISPFCLKLETWLRIADIKYEVKLMAQIWTRNSKSFFSMFGSLPSQYNVETKWGTFSKKGQVPFIELNGKEIPDSNFIIRELTQIFHKEHLEAHLNPMDRAVSRAIESLIEDSLFWTMVYDRSTRVPEIMGDSVFGPNFSGPVRVVKPIIQWRFEATLKGKLHAQGMGRHSYEEAMSIGTENLKTLCVYLGKKKFMTGQNVCRIDATAFGHIGQIWFLPIDNPLKKFMGTECPDLVEYLERVKSSYWPDWNEACGNRSLHTQWKMQPPASPSLFDAAT